MEENKWNPPLWNYWNRFRGKINLNIFPFPDWSNAGPLVTMQEGNFGSSEAIYVGADDFISTSNQSYEFQKAKDSSRGFPLERSSRFAYPLKAEAELSHNKLFVEQGNFIWRQGANAIDSVEVLGKTYILHPSYATKLSGISLSEFTPKRRINCGLFNNLDDVTTLPTTCESEIYQIIAKEINNRVHIASRTLNHINIYNLKEDIKTYSTLSLPFPRKENRPTSVVLSDTLPGHFAVACANGIVSLYDDPYYSREIPIWNRKMCDRYCVYQCEFGRQGFSSLVVNNQSKIWSVDTRKKSVGSDVSEIMIDINKLQEYLEGSDIICKVARSGFWHLYVVTSQAILVMDERYCKSPIMMWQHMLRHHPSFVTRSRVMDEEIFMLGSSHDYKICGVSHNLNTKKMNNIWSGLPRHFDIVRDTIQFAHQHDAWFNHQVNRFGNNYAGLTSFVNPCSTSSLCLLALNDTNDIFVQNFQTNDNGVNENKTLCLPTNLNEIGKKLLDSWEEQVINTSVKEADKPNPHIRHKYSKWSRDPADMTNLYHGLEKSAREKKCYTHKKSKVWNFQGYVVDSITSRSKEKSYVSEESPNRSWGKGLQQFIPNEFSHFIQSTYYESCSDKMSQNLLNIWKSKKDIKDNNIPSKFKRNLSACDIDNDTSTPKRFKLYTSCSQEKLPIMPMPSPILDSSVQSSSASKKKIKKKLAGF